MNDGEVMTTEERLARIEYVLGTLIAWVTNQNQGAKLLAMLHDNDPRNIPEFFLMPALIRYEHEIRTPPPPLEDQP